MPLPQPWEPFLDNLCVWECVHCPGLLFLSLQLTVQLSTGQNHVDQTDFEVELLKGKKEAMLTEGRLDRPKLRAVTTFSSI